MKLGYNDIKAALIEGGLELFKTENNKRNIGKRAPLVLAEMLNKRSPQSTRLLKVSELEVGMIVLVRSGRARIEVSRPCYGESGWLFIARYVDGEHKGTEYECRSVLDNDQWIEEPTDGA